MTNLEKRLDAKADLMMRKLLEQQQHELADKFANEATELEDDAQPTSLKAGKAVIKRTLKDKPPSHARTADVYANHSTAKDENTMTNRRDAVLLTRLRAGHSMQLAAYRHLMDPTTDPRCPKCFQDNQTLEHWLLECPATLTGSDNRYLATPTPSFQFLPTIRSRRSSWRSAASEHASASTQKKKKQQQQPRTTTSRPAAAGTNRLGTWSHLRTRLG